MTLKWKSIGQGTAMSVTALLLVGCGMMGGTKVITRTPAQLGQGAPLARGIPGRPGDPGWQTRNRRVKELARRRYPDRPCRVLECRDKAPDAVHR